MLNINQIYSESSFECAELEFQLLIYKFQVEVSESVDDSSPTNWALNKFHSNSL
jgi:hypothetical protein